MGLTGDYSITVGLLPPQHPELAFTDGKRIFINTLHELFESEPLDDMAKYCLALVVHESLHPIYSCFQCIEDAATKRANETESLVMVRRHLFNILEDARIERIGAFKFPGVAYAISDLNEFIFEHAKEPEEDDSLNILLSMIADFVSVNKIRRKLTGELEDVWEKIFPLAQKAKYADTCSECYLHTKKIMYLLKKYISKKTKINRGELDRYLVSNNHPPIIDRETFWLVKKEMAKRSSKRRVSENAITELGRYSGKYALSELLFCDVCGAPFRRKSWSRKGVKKVYWRCLGHLEKGNEGCPQSKGIEEKLLHETICRALTAIIPDKSDVKSLAKTMLAYSISGDQLMLEYRSIENSIKDLLAKANNAEVMCIRTEGNKEPYMEEIKKYYATIAQLREQLSKLKEQLNSSETFQTELNLIDEWLGEEQVSFEKYDDSIVRYLVSSIRVTEDLKLVINLKGGGTITEPVCLEKN